MTQNGLKWILNRSFEFFYPISSIYSSFVRLPSHLCWVTMKMRSDSAQRTGDRSSWWGTASDWAAQSSAVTQPCSGPSSQPGCCRKWTIMTTSGHWSARWWQGQGQETTMITIMIMSLWCARLTGWLPISMPWCQCTLASTHQGELWSFHWRWALIICFTQFVTVSALSLGTPICCVWFQTN